MPELPEVETIVRELQRALPPSRVEQIAVSLPKIVKLPLWAFRRRLLRTVISGVRRRAKLVLLNTTNRWTIVIHLKMSGQLIWEPRRGRRVVGGHPIPGALGQLPNKYSHVVFICDRGTLFFNDQRQFGFIKLVRTEKLDQWLDEQHFGPEPLSPRFTFKDFQAILDRQQRKRIKPTLMDQRIIAGIGNIYADEACHFARILPDRRIRSLNSHERHRLYRGLRHILALAIRRKGTSANAYVRTSGEKGRMLPFLRVYGRNGQQCRRCGGGIKKISLAGRGTHFCPRCQH